LLLLYEKTGDFLFESEIGEKPLAGGLHHRIPSHPSSSREEENQAVVEPSVLQERRCTFFLFYFSIDFVVL
jgi:hypothetical protein